MRGRKGYSLQSVIGDLRRIKKDKKELLEGIKENNPGKVVKTSVGILSKSDKALDSLAYSFIFADSITREYSKLKTEKTKERRKKIAKKWADFRKKNNKIFDSTINRSIVDSATKIFGGEK